VGLLDGKVALVTGGARGQGAAEGRLFAQEGATVVLADVLDDVGEETAAGIDNASYRHLDVTSESDWQAVIDDIVEAHGRFDVLMNNAGIFKGAQLLKTDTEMWDRMIAVNQTGVFFGMRTGARAMVDAGNGGSIINTSSIAGTTGVFGSTAYGATKWAVRGMTRVAAKELGRYGIRVNSIHPGVIETDMIADLPDIADPERRARTMRSIPIGRYGTADDIAQMALFLASDMSSFCSGHEFIVDGGQSG
jgi:3alpha(or 20beta)-hydroxysteroid dehydrogenase